MVYRQRILSALLLSISLLAQIALSQTSSLFIRHTVDSHPDRPAFVKVGDLDGDGRQEILVSMFAASPLSSGHLAMYRLEGEGFFNFKKTKLAGFNTRFPNDPAIEDVNSDGLKDVILPSGFLPCLFPLGSCGGITLLIQDENGQFHSQIITQKQKRFYHHIAYVDWDNDGIKDIIAVGEEKNLLSDGSSKLHFFKGNQNSTPFTRRPKEIANGLGSFPVVMDIDHDGSLEVLSSEYFGSKGSFSWVDKTPSGRYERYYIDNAAGKAIQFSVVKNLFGRGQNWGIGANHTNTNDDKNSAESAVYLYAFPDFKSYDFNPHAPWQRTKISEGIVSDKSGAIGKSGAPGVFATGDIDHDGDIDIVVSGDGDPRIFWLRQDGYKKFTTIVIDENMSQGGVDIGDIDGDGKMEVVATSYGHNVVYVYAFKE